MAVTAEVEHFCTLFDQTFLPQGMALHESLMRHRPKARLWVLCLDSQVAESLRKLALVNVELVTLAALETEEPRLQAVKPTRNWRSYCWTVSPFVYDMVFRRAPDARRVTYIDADLYFFDDPRTLLAEFDDSDKHVQITEHAYGPGYDRTDQSGRFCVQFQTFDRSPEARCVLDWWQERCLEWCHDYSENGLFGDQVYLNQWPDLFGDAVHILQQKHLTLAPWNVDFFYRARGPKLRPVFYHFHSLRIIGPRDVRLFEGYLIGRRGRRLYAAYLRSLAAAIERMRSLGLELKVRPLPPEQVPGKFERTVLRFTHPLGLGKRLAFARLPAAE